MSRLLLLATVAMYFAAAQEPTADAPTPAPAAPVLVPQVVPNVAGGAGWLEVAAGVGASLAAAGVGAWGVIRRLQARPVEPALPPPPPPVDPAVAIRAVEVPSPSEVARIAERLDQIADRLAKLDAKMAGHGVSLRHLETAVARLEGRSGTTLRPDEETSDSPTPTQRRPTRR